MKQRRMAGWMAAMLVLAAISVPAKFASAAEEMDILHMIQTAKTPQDHEAIAKYYDAQAAEAKKKAEFHREMASSYTAGGTPTGKGTKASFPQHCLALAKQFDDEAAHYTAMADMQRELAKPAK